MKRFGAIIAAMLSVVFMAALLSGCTAPTSHSDDTVARAKQVLVDPNGKTDVSFYGNKTSVCIDSLEDYPGDGAHLRAYEANPANDFMPFAVAAAGTQTVCVLSHKMVNGYEAYTMHYYNNELQSADYPYYLMAQYRAFELLKNGIYDNKLRPSDELVMVMTNTISSTGAPVQPYSMLLNGWLQTPMFIGAEVEHVYFGADPVPVSYSASLTPPAGYEVMHFDDQSDAIAHVVDGKIVDTYPGAATALYQWTTADTLPDSLRGMTEIHP